MTLFGAIGTVATLIGLWLTYRQSKEAQSAAQAARAAAEKAELECRRQSTAFFAASAHRILREAKMHVQHLNWEAAVMRVGDLADQLAQLENALGVDAHQATLVSDARGWESTFSRIASGEIKFTRASQIKWRKSSDEIAAKIDRHHAAVQPGDHP